MQYGDKKVPHAQIEAKWQRYWFETKQDVVDIDNAKKPYFNLMMFPYPSAEGLHVGNMYAFTGSDIFGRFMRMQGNDVFEPIGLDGFGIHSENFALKIGRHPKEHAVISEKNFYKQLHTIGAMFDWSRTVETYNPNYYLWTQWLFTKMFEHGLAYRGKAPVTWCGSCKTVLSDEQCIDDACERCGNKVENKSLEQWFFRITAYAVKLLENSFGLDWSEKVRVAQQNWIGKKEGINLRYDVVDEQGKKVNEVTCFTTRPDTNFGATFVVIAPEHPLLAEIINLVPEEKKADISRYIQQAKTKTKEERIVEGREKSGVFTGLYCLNHLTKYKMPLYVSDFVVMSVGTGVVVGVPGHDKRDFEFAKKFKLSIKRVVVAKDGDKSEVTKLEQVQEEEGIMINSGFLDGLDIHAATQKIMDYFEEKGWGKKTVTYHLRDWLISRQRYWGPPIPLVYCQACKKLGKGERKEMPGWWSVPENDLPVLLPHIQDYKPGDDGVAPLAKHQEFYETKCPGCGAQAVRETDVSDTFLDSSWYFLRYPFVNRDGSLPWDPEIMKKWLPVHMYTGGAEHSVLHLMYSRFVCMALHDWGYLNFEEPFAKFFAHGLVIKDGAKMSKSKGNVVNPDEYIRLYGADALRLYLMFMGPFSEGGDFRDASMEGMARWVGRIWRMVQNHTDKKQPEVEKTLHRLVKKVTEDLEKRRYNTAIAAMMEFTNLVADKGGKLSGEDLATFLKLLAPLAPFLTEELWERSGGKFSIHQQLWPSFDASMLTEDTVQIIVQVNGKLRDTLAVQIQKSKDQKEIEKLAQASPKVSKYLFGQTIKKVIFVPGKLMNFVI